MAVARDAPSAIFVGFDAMAPDLVRQWAMEGHLPNFARVLAQGASVQVEHESGLYVGAIWPTVVTGVGVDRHGFYTGIRPAPFSYHYIAEEIGADPFWVDVARAGRRIAVVDVPFERAVEGLDGLQLLEWGCHDRYYGPHAEPPELLDEVVRDVGVHPIGMIDHPAGFDRFAPCDSVHVRNGRRDPEDVVRFVSTLNEALELRAQMSKYVNGRGPFGLVVDIIGELHCAGHHLWSLHDPSHPHHDPALAARLGGDPLLASYKSMDSLLAQYLTDLDGATLYVFLSHGMQGHFDGTHLLDEVLWRLDLAYRGVPVDGVGARTEQARQLLSKLPPLARAATVRRLGPLVGRMGWDDRPTPPLEVPGPQDRLWYALENNTVSGAVRFNRQGREPQGALGPAMTRQAARWLEHELRQIVNLDDGRPVIESVYLSDDLYRRRPEDGLPDLLLEWRRERPIENVWSPTIGRIGRPYEGVRTGDHDRTGELIAVGDGVVTGRHGTVAPVDIAPTVAAATGIFLHDADGAPITPLLPQVVRIQRDAARTTAALEASDPPRSVRGAGDEVVALRRDFFALQRRVEGLSAAHHETRALAAAAREDAEVLRDILATTSWIRADRVVPGTRISVVMPTRNRRPLLERAVGSVLAQTHHELELIVVDDASEDDTAAWLSSVEDDRLVVVRNAERLGEGGSRNAGLDVAAGEIVAFLDDDNHFDPDWLRSVAWLFQKRPDAQVAYGARIIDDIERHEARAEGGQPWLQLNAWDRATNAVRCLVDVNVLAHRAGPVRFDPSLPLYADWDYLLGLTADVDPVRLAVIATRYTTTAADRASVVDDAVREELYQRVRARWQRDG